MEPPERLVEVAGAPPLFGVLAPGRPGPAVVWLHGWAGNRQGPNRLFVELARGLARASVPSLRIDFSGHGESPGRPEGPTLDGMIEEAIRASRHLCAEARADPVILAGICSGGNVAMGAASRSPDAAGGLVLLSTPVFREARTPGGRIPRRLRVARELAGRFVRGGWRRLLRGEADVRGAARYLRGDAPSGPDPRDSSRDVLRDLAGFRGRVLLVYGTRDTESGDGPRVFESRFRAAGNPLARLDLEGANHNFLGVEWRERILAGIRDWVGGFV